jgi:hypothetical protein
MLLNYIGENGMQTGGKYVFFPMGKLAEINSRISQSYHMARCCKFFEHFYKDNFLIPAQKKDEFL